MAAQWTPRRRAIVVGSGLVFVALLAAALLWFPAWSHALVIAELESVFARPVSAEAVRFRFFPTEMEVRRLRVEGVRPGDAPWLEVPRLSILPSFGLIWEGRIVLSRVRIEKPVIRVQAFADGGDNMPRLHMGGRGVFGVRIRRLTIEGGELILDHQRVPLELDLPEVDGRLTGRRGGILAGRITMGPGEARFGTAPPVTLQTELDVVMDGPRLTLESGRVRTATSDLGVSGELQLVRQPEGRFDIEGPLDLAELDRHVTRTGFQLTGVSQYRGVLQVEGSKLSLTGDLKGERGSWKGEEVPTFQGNVAWASNEGVRVRSLALSVFGGTALLDLDVPPAGRTARLSGRLANFDADHAVARLFEVGLVGAAGSATGDVRLEWPRGRFRDLTGTVRLQLRALEGGRAPVSGRFDWSAQAGVQRFEHVDLGTPETHLRLQGRVARDGRADLSLVARSGDLATSDALVLRLRRALGNTIAAPFAVAGTGSFDGFWRGTLTAPVYEGRASASDLVYLGVTWGRADWVGRAGEREIECRSLVLRKGPGELWIDGRLEPGVYAKKDAVDVRVRLDTWPVEDLVRALEWDVPWEGDVSGQAQITGHRSVPWGTADLTGKAGRYFGVPYQGLRLETTLQGDRIRAEHGEARIGGGPVRFVGVRTDAGVYDGSLEADDVDIGELLPPARADVRWGGRVSGTASLEGTFEKPKLRARLTSRRLFLGDEGLGALEADIQGDGQGALAVRARCESPRTHVELEGRVDAAAPYTASLTARAQETSLDPLVRALLAAPAASLPAVIAGGQLKLDGPLGRPAELTASVQVPDLQLKVPDYPVRSDGPLVADLAQGELTVRELRLAGEGTNLLASGTAMLLRDGPIDFTVKGDADLRSLAAITRRFRARGAADLTLAVRGTRDAPQLDGTLRLQGAGIRVKDFPHGLEEVHGSVRFTERAAELRDVVGRLGGGEVQLEGQTAYGRAGVISMDLKLSGRDIALRYPEGLRSVTGGELRLFGDGEHQWLTGAVEIRQAVWTRRYDVVSEMLDAQQALAAPAGSLGTPVRFDIKVNAPGTVKVDNNLASLEARADLRLQGTSDNPVVVGRADVDRGRVYFQGNTYLIRRGRIEFANPHRIDPYFDMEAETRLRSYRVNLRMNGTLDHVYPTLTSDPPLSSVQILSLLAGAEESEVARLTEARTDRALLASQGAASLAAGRIAEGVGLERQAERLFGLNRFSIDPSVLKGSVTRPAARITVGKRLTPDLNVLYSQDLSGNEERLFSVEYTLRDWLSMLLTRSETGGFGVDARVQRSR